ncbi:leucine-rich repeat-containing protein 41 [Trichomycterus rosablanca]|uniref:leucine-rich repeat-containing protein 41 n=1 Tax=Trichomycterus rosablanca TaxID=2290929 RepID=UPI002F351D7B
MAEQTLVQKCISSVVQHINLLENRITDLPASLLKDLLPHLNFSYLDRIEAVARLKGVSTAFVWASRWKDLNVTWRYRLKLKQSMEEDWKQKCLESYFHMRLFGNSQGFNLNPSDHTDFFLAAKHMRVLSLFRARDVRRLISEDLRPILTILERELRMLRLLDAKLMVECKKTDLFFILHRLLDHGSVRELHLKMPDSSVLNWLTSRSADAPHARSSPDEGPAVPKRPRLHFSNEAVHDVVSPCCGADRTCPRGEIHALNLEVWSVAEVTRLLPSWTHLHSLHLYVIPLLWEQEVDELVESFRKLFLNPHCSLRDLSLGNICVRAHLAALLTSCPRLQSLALEINLPRDPEPSPSRPFQPNTELSLEKLSIKTVDVQMMVENFQTVLRLAPKLTSLHVTGVKDARPLLHTLPESNPNLKVLRLEDINLSDCHQELLHLLQNSALEEVCLKDCRLLDKCREKKDFLVSFVAAVRSLSSLRLLSLAQNRLASSVIEVADLYSGEHTSNITKLDLSSNFILPADLLEFSRRIETYRPAQRFTLNLCFNPLDRDPEVRSQALKKLLPFCDIRTDDWDSRATMADHVSVM